MDFQLIGLRPTFRVENRCKIAAKWRKSGAKVLNRRKIAAKISENLERKSDFSKSLQNDAARFRVTRKNYEKSEV